MLNPTNFMSYSLYRLLIISCMIFLAGCTKQAASDTSSGVVIDSTSVSFQAHAPQLSSISVEPVLSHDHFDYHLTGRVVWNEDKTVRVYSPIEGRVKSIAVDIGSVVKEGSLLARLDSLDYGQAQSDFRKSEADLRFAKSTFNRLKDLFEHGAAAKKDVEAAQDSLSDAEFEYQRALTRLNRYGLTGTHKVVDSLYAMRSPISGVVVDKNINVGQEIRGDLMLANDPKILTSQFVISDPRSLWISLDATEMDISILRMGEPLRITSRALPDKVFEGKLVNIGQALDPVTRTIKVRGEVDNRDLNLKAEMYVDVEINQAADPAKPLTAIPAAAVFTAEGRHYVFVEKSAGRFVRTEIAIATESEGKIIVKEGLHAGERIVVEGSLLVESLLESGASS